MARKDIDHGRPRLVCTRMMEARSCGNRRRYYLDDIEDRVIGALRTQLGSPEAISYFVERYNDELRHAGDGAVDRRRSIEKQLATVERKIERAVRAIIDGRLTELEAAAHLPELRRKRNELSAELDAVSARPIVFKPKGAAIEEYLDELAALGERGGADSECGRLVRQMLSAIVVEPAQAPGPPRLIVNGDLGPILGLRRPFAGGSGGAG